MKYKGKQVGPSVDYCVIPRPDGDFVVKCLAVADFSEYEEVAKLPVPPFNIGKGGVKIANVEDGTYKQQKLRYDVNRMIWLVLKSISDNPDIVFERVDITDVNTYGEYEKELKEAGLNQIEINRIQATALRVNSLDEAHIQEARELFLLTKAAELETTSGLPVEPSTT